MTVETCRRGWEAPTPSRARLRSHWGLRACVWRHEQSSASAEASWGACKDKVKAAPTEALLSAAFNASVREGQEIGHFPEEALGSPR